MLTSDRPAGIRSETFAGPCARCREHCHEEYKSEIPSLLGAYTCHRWFCPPPLVAEFS